VGDFLVGNQRIAEKILGDVYRTESFFLGLTLRLEQRYLKLIISLLFLVPRAIYI